MMHLKFKNIKTIHTRTLIIVIAAIIVFFILNVGTIIVNERKVLMERALEHSLELSCIKAENVGLRIDNSGQLLVKLANDPAAKKLDDQMIYKVLNRMLQFDEALYLDAYYIKGNSVTNAQGQELEGEVRNYYRKMLETREPYQLVEVMHCEGCQAPSIAISAPIMDQDGNVIAAVAFAIDVKEFSNRIDKHELPGSSFVWITDNYGTIIAHPNEDYPLNLNISDAHLVGMEDFQRVSVMMMREEKGYGTYYDNNLDKVKIVTFVEIPNTPGWKLNITIHEEDIYGHIPGVINQVLLITIVLSLIFIVVANWLTTTIMKPINQLTYDVENSVDHNYKPIPLESHYTEINKLIMAYNSMIDQITTYTQELEEIVEERTNRLNVLNTQLNQQNRHLNETIASLNEVSKRDTLTGLFNRGMLYKYLEETINDIEIGLIDEATVFFLDLDNFKYYNDTFGHDIGDQILLKVRDVFHYVLRKGDFIARYGGDEFVIVLKSVSAENAKKIKIKIMLGISDMIAGFVKDEWQAFIGHQETASSLLGVSIGMVQLQGNYLPSIDELLIEADAMMYSDKQKKK